MTDPPRNGCSSARRLIECAALLGYRFDAPVLARCCRLTRAAASQMLDTMCADGMFVCESRREGRYRFGHELYRSTIRAALDPAVARALHARIAATLERLPESDVCAEILVHHWSAAGNRRRAQRYRKLAAAEARRLGSSM